MRIQIELNGLHINVNILRGLQNGRQDGPGVDVGFVVVEIRFDGGFVDEEVDEFGEFVDEDEMVGAEFLGDEVEILDVLFLFAVQGFVELLETEFDAGTYLRVDLFDFEYVFCADS